MLNIMSCEILLFILFTVFTVLWTYLLYFSYKKKCKIEGGLITTGRLLQAHGAMLSQNRPIVPTNINEVTTGIDYITLPKNVVIINYCDSILYGGGGYSDILQSFRNKLSDIDWSKYDNSICVSSGNIDGINKCPNMIYRGNQQQESLDKMILGYIVPVPTKFKDDYNYFNKWNTNQYLKMVSSTDVRSREYVNTPDYILPKVMPYGHPDLQIATSDQINRGSKLSEILEKLCKRYTSGLLYLFLYSCRGIPLGFRSKDNTVPVEEYIKHYEEKDHRLASITPIRPLWNISKNTTTAELNLDVQIINLDGKSRFNITDSSVSSFNEKLQDLLRSNIGKRIEILYKYEKMPDYYNDIGDFYAVEHDIIPSIIESIMTDFNMIGIGIKLSAMDE